MDNQVDDISFTEDSLNNDLIQVSMKIEESINQLKKYFDKIGTDGEVWDGNVANVTKETFEELVTKYYSFRELDKEYIEYLDRK